MNEPKRLRRPPVGGYARGDETRLRIIEAAIDLFGEYGFDGASTRDIAARAGVNAPALQYYFENKEGVLRACAEFIADETWAVMGPVAAHIGEVLRSQADTPALIDAYIQLLETLADKMFAKSHAPNHRLFFAREQAGREPDIATEILNQRVRQPLNELAAALISRIIGTTPDDPVTRIRMLTLHGQLLIFHIAPRTSMTVLGWTEIDAQKSELLKQTMRDQSRVLLEHWSRERAEPSATIRAPARVAKSGMPSRTRAAFRSKTQT